jgi:hypothetical protein
MAIPSNFDILGIGGLLARLNQRFKPSWKRRIEQDAIRKPK